jgi:hypothetical protein
MEIELNELDKEWSAHQAINICDYCRDIDAVDSQPNALKHYGATSSIMSMMCIVVA